VLYSKSGQWLFLQSAEIYIGVSNSSTSQHTLQITIQLKKCSHISRHILGGMAKGSMLRSKWVMKLHPTYSCIWRYQLSPLTMHKDGFMVAATCKYEHCSYIVLYKYRNTICIKPPWQLCPLSKTWLEHRKENEWAKNQNVHREEKKASRGKWETYFWQRDSICWPWTWKWNAQ